MISWNRALLFILMTLLVNSTLTTNAQEFKYGFVMGTGVSSMYMTEVPIRIYYNSMYAPLPSFNINAFVSYKGRGFLGVSLEPGFINRGAVQLFNYLKQNFPPIYNKVIVDFNYFELPAFINMYFTKKFYASIGLAYEYRLTEKATITEKATFNDRSVFVAKRIGYGTFAEHILPDSDDRISMSGIIGINYSLDNRFDFGLKYGYGLKGLIRVGWYNSYLESIGNSNIFEHYLQCILKVKL